MSKKLSISIMLIAGSVITAVVFILIKFYWGLCASFILWGVGINLIIMDRGFKKTKEIHNIVIDKKRHVCQFADEEGNVVFEAKGSKKKTKFGITTVYKSMTPSNPYYRSFSAYQRRALTNTIRAKILDRDEFTCQHCGAKAPDVAVQIDHIVPIAKGGTTEINNLQVLCKDCNNGKRDKFEK